MIEENVELGYESLGVSDELSLFSYVNDAVMREVYCTFPVELKMLSKELRGEIVAAFGEGGVESVEVHYLISESLGNMLSRYAEGECLYRFENCTYLWGCRTREDLMEYSVLRQVFFLAGLY
jgi:hypothetical protein